MITVAFLDEESTVEEAPVSIVLTKLNEDGTTGELQLEGDLRDVHALASTLEAEGNCVEVGIARPDEGGEEAPGESGANEEPQAGGEVPNSGENVIDPAESLVPSAP